MASSSIAMPSPERPAHKRSRSAVLKSLVMPSSRTPSPTKASPSKGHARGQTVDLGSTHKNTPVLGERSQNRDAASRSPAKRSLRNNGSSDDDSRFYRGLSKSPSKKRQHDAMPKEKENTTPPSTADVESRPPIWAQFATTASNESTSSRTPVLPAKDEIFNETRRSNLAPRSPSRTSVKDFARYNQSTSSSQASDRLAGAKIWDDDLERPSSKSSASSLGSDGPGKVAAAVAMINGKHTGTPKAPSMSREELDAAFEAVLNKRNIPEKMRETMRKLDPTIKADFIKHGAQEESPVEESPKKKNSAWSTFTRGRTKSTADQQKPDAGTPSSPSKRGRSRGRTVNAGDATVSSPTKRGRSTSRPRSLFSLKNLSSTSVNKVGLDGASDSKEGPLSPRSTEASDPFRRPADFVEYLSSTPQLQEIEIGKLHKLRLLLRNESVSWVDTFILKDGMKQLLDLLQKIKKLEWRSEHDDLLLHEVLLCMKGLCTTQRALDKLAEAAPTIFPSLLEMLLDEERKGPSEFTTRGVVISLLFIHLSTASTAEKPERAKTILAYLADPLPAQSERPPEFVLGMTRNRPYQKWCKEIGNVIKEVFWIFIHHTNVVPLPPDEAETPEMSYLEKHFPKTRPPEALNPWVGGIEWEATNYLSTHMDLVNGLLASLPSIQDRNQLRDDLRASSFEKVVGSLRLCKEKFYPSPHDVMREWVAAGVEDGWVVDSVRMFCQAQEGLSPTKSPSKDKKPAPKLDLPNFDIPGMDRWVYKP